MFASVNNSTDSSGEIIGYISAGIQSVASQQVEETDVVTPYSVFPTMLFDKRVALSWWKNMVDGKKMQSRYSLGHLGVVLLNTITTDPYGSTESVRQDGSAISSFVSWDSKITTVNALLGGITRFVRRKMKKDGIYSNFIEIARQEYGRVFQDLKGENIPLCLPTFPVPDAGLENSTECSI